MLLVQISWQSHALSEHELKLQARNWNESRHRIVFAVCLFRHNDQNTHKYIFPFEQIQEPSQWQEYEYTIGKWLWDVTHDAKRTSLCCLLVKKPLAFGSLRLPINISILYWHLVTNAESFSTSKNLRIGNWTRKRVPRRYKWIKDP